MWGGYDECSWGGYDEGVWGGYDEGVWGGMIEGGGMMSKSRVGMMRGWV